MKKNTLKKIILITILTLTLTTGCTKYLSDNDKKRITNEKTGQSLTSNILCKPEEKELFDKMCDAFDLPEDKYTRPLETFSSGELRKIDLARALSHSSDLLILDEPLNYMDYLFKAQLKKAITDQELTLIFVEHDREFGKAIATKTVYL